MSEVHKVVLITDTTVGNIKQVLLDALMWLDKDAQYAHPRSKVRQFKDNVMLTLQQVRNDEIKFQGKKFNVEVPGDIPTPSVVEESTQQE